MRTVCLLAVMLLAVSAVAYAGSGRVGYLRGITVLDGNRLLLSSDSVAHGINISLDGGKTWHPRTLYPRFFSYCDGLAYNTSDTMLYKTTDGGQSWTLWSTRSMADSRGWIYFDLNTFWMLRETVVVGTSDGGTSWYEILNNGGRFESRIRTGAQLDRNHVWLLSDDSLYQTTDGGVSWNSWQKTNFWFSTKFLAVLDSLHGIREDGDFQSADVLFTTSDGGHTWNYVGRTGSAKFIDPAHGWSVDGGYIGYTYLGLSRTTDGGNTWQQCNSPSPGRPLNGFDITDDGKWVWAIFGDSLYNSTDGGDSWNWIPVNIDTSTAYVPCYDIGKQSVSDWSLVSAASSTSPRPFTSVYPSAISGAFSFGHGYIAADSMEPGIGYWVKFNGNDRLTVPVGDSLTCITIPVHMGWNLIGGLSLPVDIESITQTPDHILITQAFTYTDGTYTPSNTLEPGRGYWIKAGAEGTLHLGATGGIPRQDKHGMKRSNPAGN